MNIEMADHNQLREKLTATKRYRRLVDLRREVQGSRGSIPFSIYADLENRIDEKIRNFDYPMCEQARVTVMFSNGLAMELDPDECVSAMRSDMRLSSYIFSKYPSAVDFNLEDDDQLGSFSKKLKSDEMDREELKNSLRSNPMEQENIQGKVEFLIGKIDRLEKMYNETIPRISAGIDDLKSKMDYLYKKLLEEKR